MARTVPDLTQSSQSRYLQFWGQHMITSTGRVVQCFELQRKNILQSQGFEDNIHHDFCQDCLAVLYCYSLVLGK